MVPWLPNGSVIEWTKDESEILADLKMMYKHATWFPDRTLLREMGLLGDFDKTLKMMELKAFASMDYLTHDHITREFLATVQLEFERPRTKTASKGFIWFKLGNKGQTLSIFDLCDVYKFPKKPLVKFPTFNQADAFWGIIGENSEYVSTYAKGSFVRK